MLRLFPIFKQLLFTHLLIGATLLSQEAIFAFPSTNSSSKLSIRSIQDSTVSKDGTPHEDILEKFQQDLLTSLFLASGENFDLGEWEKEAEIIQDGKKDASEEGDNQELEIEFISEIESIKDEENYEIAYQPSPQDEDRFEGLPPLQEEDSFPSQQSPLPQQLLPEMPQHQKVNPSIGSQNSQNYGAFIYVSFENGSHPGYYLKPFKVTNREYQRFVKAINYRPPSHWVEGKIPGGLEEAPVVNVSYKDAFLYAIWSGKRLPTKGEVEKAVIDDLISFEESAPLEWTSTPIATRERDPLLNGSLQIGSPSTLMHQVFGGEKEIAMPSHECNHRTGFRLAADGY